MPKDYDRCVKAKVNKKTYYVCARCLGLYIGLITFLIVFFSNVFFDYISIVLAAYIFPIPAFLDWSLHKFKKSQGTNVSRIITGFMVGITYAALIYLFVRNPFDYNFWIVIVAYAALLIILLKLLKKI